MFSVALIGPDGAGKTTVCQALARQLPVPSRYVYMGINLEASSLMLPWTWLYLQLKRARGKRPDLSGPQDPARIATPPRGLVRRLAAGSKAALRLANQLAEEWFRQCVVWGYQRRGYVVLFDRHYLLDYYASDVAPAAGHRPLHRRIHGFILRRLYPRPDVTVYLDAPADVLLARKGEGTLEYLERKRAELSSLENILQRFVRIDALQPVDDIVRQIGDVVCRDYDLRRRGAAGQRGRTEGAGQGG